MHGPFEHRRLQRKAMQFLRRLEQEGHAIALAKISLDLRGGGRPADTQVVFELSIGARSFGSIAIAAPEIGVPLSWDEAKSRQASDDGYFLPDSIIDFTRSALQPDEPLYLAFQTPCGFLPGLPWERLGCERLGRPVLRLGAAPVRPVRSETTLDVAYCCSLPACEQPSPVQIAESMLRQIPADLPQRARVHVFVDRTLYPVLSERIDTLGHPATIRLHAPTDAERYVNPRPSGSEMLEAEQLENPWLLWMRDALRELSLDGVHFITGGYLGRSRVGLRFADSPVEAFDNYAGARVVGARQLVLFLEQVGAWAVAFSSPPRNDSVLGLRMLFDEVSRMLNGPAVLHDMAADADGHALASAYWSIYAPGEAPLPRSPALALAMHPAWAGGLANDAPAERMQALVDEYSLRHRVSSLTGADDTPGWVSAQQRRLEKSIAAIASVPEAERDPAREAGVLDALRFTADLIAKYAPRAGTAEDASDTSPPGGSATTDGATP